MTKELIYPSKETIHKLTKDLKLQGATCFTQDWEIEVAKVEQLQSYIEYYQKENLNLNEKATLMRIILVAYDDFCTMNCKEDAYGEIIKQILIQDYAIHEETIRDWWCIGQDLEDCFTITAFIREIKDNISVPFRIAVNIDKEEIMQILRICDGCIIEQGMVEVDNNVVMISNNDDYDENLWEDKADGFLYYKCHMDFYPKDDTIMLEEQIKLAQRILKMFTNEGIRAVIVAEFEDLL